MARFASQQGFTPIAVSVDASAADDASSTASCIKSRTTIWILSTIWFVVALIGASIAVYSTENFHHLNAIHAVSSLQKKSNSSHFSSSTATPENANLAPTVPPSFAAWTRSPSALLSRTLYEKAQANPHALSKEELLAFEAAPWLLPPNTNVFSWHGVNNIDAMAELRSKPHGKYPKTISMTMFTHHFTNVTLNGIYTMVKFGQVDNYMVITIDEGNLRKCLELNLPCVNVRSILPIDLGDAGGLNRDGAELMGTEKYRLVTWVKPLVAHYLLQKGYAVFVTDNDIGFGPHHVWDSYLRYIEDGNATAAFQGEHPVNTGNYVVLPTQEALDFFGSWTELAKANGTTLNDQFALPQIANTFMTCFMINECKEARQRLIDQGKPQLPLFRQYAPSAIPIWNVHCAFMHYELAPKIDPCYWAAFYVHPICNRFPDKEPSLKAAGYWYIDDSDSRFLPTIFSVPEFEDLFASCTTYPLALTYIPKDIVQEHIELRDRVQPVVPP